MTNFRENIFDTTQAGYMNKITRIIETTFDKMFTEYENNKIKCSTLENNLNATQNMLTQRNEELNAITSAKIELEDNLQKLKSDYEDVIQIKNQFYHNILRKNKLLNELTEQQQQLQEKNKELTNECEKCKEELSLYSSEKNFWRKRFEDMRAEAESLKLQSEHLRIKLCSTENEIDKCFALFKNVEVKVFKNSENFEAISKVYEELHNKIEVSNSEHKN